MQETTWKTPAAVGVAVLLVSTLTAHAASANTPAAEPDIRRDRVVEAVEAVMPCVVNVATATVVEYEYGDPYQQMLREFFGWGRPAPREQFYSIGSGVIIDEEGWVLTNLHVVRHASRIQIKMWNGEVYEAEAQVGTGFSDLALLRIHAPPDKKFQAVHFAKPDDLLLGETVVALGNPFGLGASVSRGILSSKNRRPVASDETLGLEDWLQTDAAINPGNSGGPLINLRGDLIGLNVAIYQKGEGIGFAIPVKRIGETLSYFFSPEMSSSMWFGAQVKSPPSPLEVVSVQDQSPASEAGLKVGDRILSINGKEPKGLSHYNNLLCTAPFGKVSLAVQGDDGDRRELKISLLPFEQLTWRKLGLSLAKVRSQGDSRYQFEENSGLRIDEVEDGGPADQAGLRQGAFLVAMDGVETSDLRHVAGPLSSRKAGETVRLTVIEPRPIGRGFVQYRRRVVEVPVR